MRGAETWTAPPGRPRRPRAPRRRHARARAGRGSRPGTHARSGRSRARSSPPTSRPARGATPTKRKLGSASEARHSFALRLSWRARRRSSRASSIQVRSRGHSRSSASCAISTVGSRGRRLTVERQQTVPAERVEHRVEVLDAQVERGELGTRDAPAGVLAPLAQGDEPEQDLTRGVGAGRAHRPDQVLGAHGERSGHPADLAVRLEGHRAADVTALEQLGQGELDQRQGARLVRHVADDLGDQARLDAHADLARGAGDGALELVGGERGHRHRPFGEQLAEPRLLQRPVVEVGSQRDDDPHPAPRVGDRHPEQLEEGVTLALVLGEGEDLLELVDDQQQLGVARDASGRSTWSRPREPASSRSRSLPAGLRRDPQQGGLEFLDRDGRRGTSRRRTSPRIRGAPRPPAAGAGRPGPPRTCRSRSDRRPRGSERLRRPSRGGMPR